MASRKIIDDAAFRQSRSARFWKNVDTSAGYDACWPWLGTRLKSGYGKVRFLGRTTTAHRIAYELATGERIPYELRATHSCDNPPCCNPRHVEPATQTQNIADMDARGRRGDSRNFGEDHGRCVVTDVQVSEIKTLYLTGISQGNLAKQFGIGQSQVSRIIRGESRGTSTVDAPIRRHQ